MKLLQSSSCHIRGATWPLFRRARLAVQLQFDIKAAMTGHDMGFAHWRQPTRTTCIASLSPYHQSREHVFYVVVKKKLKTDVTNRSTRFKLSSAKGII